MSALRVVFAGTPEFAVPVLEGLARSPHSLVGVLTQPDRPAGRGRRLSASAVKMAAETLGLPIEQPAKLKDSGAVQSLAAWHADVMVVVAYGLLLPVSILEIPTHGCINVHASLLPRWRGAAPVERALLEGDRETGVSIMRMESGLDTGPVYASHATPIRPDDTAGRLRSRLATLGTQALLQVLDQLAAGTAHARPQDGALATYARKIDKAEARLDFTQSAEAVERQVRAFNPAPGAFFELEGERIRILEARPEAGSGTPGTVIDATLGIACGAGVLRPLLVQRAGRSAMTPAELLRGFAVAPGTPLG